jgi:hypothetical protein
MALTLSKTNIVTGDTIQASQITQSVDALTGIVAYDITISGSLTITGSLNVTSSYAISSSRAISSSYAVSSSYAISSSRAISSSYAVSSSYAINAGASFPYTGSAIITGSLKVIGNTNITGSTNILGELTTSDNINSISGSVLGIRNTANKYLATSIDTTATFTIPASGFIPSNISTPDNWQVIEYTDNDSTTRLAYIPIYYRT